MTVMTQAHQASGHVFILRTGETTPHAFLHDLGQLDSGEDRTRISSRLASPRTWGQLPAHVHGSYSESPDPICMKL